MANAKTPAAGDNGIKLPSDAGEATIWVYKTALRHYRDKKIISEQIKEHLAEAKASGADPSAIKLAAKLNSQRDENKAAWKRKIDATATLLGYSPLGDSGTAQPPCGEHVRISNEIQALEFQRADTAKALAETLAVATAAGLDTVSIRVFLGKTQMDAIEIGEWFDGLDRTGKILGMWSAASFDDLHENLN